MTRLADNSWGKSSVRVSKIHREEGQDRFSDVTVQILVRGDVEAAYLEGDNAAVLPTDTMRNTVYGLAQEHLTADLEAFGRTLATHFLVKEGIDGADVELEERRWQRTTDHGFVGGSSERRTARIEASSTGTTSWGGIDGLVVLKTTESSFSGFPRDEYTTLPETDDRILATTVACQWRYATDAADTTANWEKARRILLDRFFGDWSASVQHQGWLMGKALLEALPDIAEVAFRLPNQHHLAYDLSRFGLEDKGVVFQPVSEPFGDIRFTVAR